jgi:transcriptional regulator with XRE-family HTH domain
MSPQVLSRLDRGDSDPRWSIIARIANTLGVSLDALKSHSGADGPKGQRIPRAVRGELRAALRELADVTKRLAAIEQHLTNSRR